jgi:hypothetical protein
MLLEFLCTISQDANIYGGQQPAQSTEKLMPSLTGIGEMSIHYAAVVQTPGPADEEVNPYIP